MEKIETIIVGGGQAGLATSYHLKQLGREHLVVEAAEKAGNAWRNDRWDSFTLVTPNWSVQLPGAHYNGNYPDSFMPKDEIVAYFEQYVEKFELPIQFNTSVLEVTPMDGGGYLLRTCDKEIQAENVVMATGSFQKPKIPAYSADIPAGITQLHSGQYRNPKQLPDGAVLVVGAAQSGMQIAEELHQAGRTIYMATGAATRNPRRYRGRDIVYWLMVTGFFDKTVDQLPSPKARLKGNPQASGKDGGHSLNLHQFARDGIQLFGHIAGAQDGKVMFAPDLRDNLAFSDKMEKDIIGMTDKYIEENGINLPAETLPNLQDGYSVEGRTELDLKAVHINSIVWAMGYKADYSLVKLPLADDDGFPVQQRGITQYPGLYFVGMHWLHKRKSGILLGVNEDAEYIVADMTERSGRSLARTALKIG